MSKEAYLVAIGPCFIDPEILTSWSAVHESSSEEYWDTIHAFDENMRFLYTYEKTRGGGWEVISEVYLD